MIALHKFKNTLDNPYADWIQIKDGFIIATNGISAIMADLNCTFGKKLFDENEELYISRIDWGNGKFDKAYEIERLENSLRSFNKNGDLIGTVNLLTFAQTKLLKAYPNVAGVFPDDSDPEIEIFFTFSELKDLVDSFSKKKSEIRMSFKGDNVCMVSENNNPVKTIFACNSLKIKGSELDGKLQELEKEIKLLKSDLEDAFKELDEKDREIDRLEEDAEKSEAVDGLKDEIEDLKEELKSELPKNLMEEQIFEEFKACLKELSYSELLAGLETLRAFKVVF